MAHEAMVDGESGPHRAHVVSTHHDAAPPHDGRRSQHWVGRRQRLHEAVHEAAWFGQGGGAAGAPRWQEEYEDY